MTDKTDGEDSGNVQSNELISPAEIARESSFADSLLSLVSTALQAYDAYLVFMLTGSFLLAIGMFVVLEVPMAIGILRAYPTDELLKHKDDREWIKGCAKALRPKLLPIAALVNLAVMALLKLAM